MPVPETISISNFLLATGIVGGLMLILGASLRPYLEELLDHASRKLRIEVHDDRKVIIYVPDGIELAWQGERLDRVVQQEVVLSNNTRAVFHEVQLRLHFRPFNETVPIDQRLVGVVIPPTPNTEARTLPYATPSQRTVEMDYLSPQSDVTMLVFTRHDGEIEFETLCDREIVVRHTGIRFAENVEKVMPAWIAVFKPIMLPLTIAAVVRRQFLRRKTK